MRKVLFASLAAVAAFGSTVVLANGDSGCKRSVLQLADDTGGGKRPLLQLAEVDGTHRPWSA